VRLLILGGNGMIGHRVWLAARERMETWVTIREQPSGQPWLELFDADRLIPAVSADDPSSLERAFAQSRPDVVFNAIGLIKQRAGATDTAAAFSANCFVPHFARHLSDAAGARLIHLSTDCVFKGDRGNYSEEDAPDAFDPYGLTKRLGEVGSPHLTLRTSAVGRSLSGTAGLAEWLLAQRGKIGGWRRALFSGLATPTLADTIVDVISDHPELHGVRHVAAQPIDKYELVRRLADAYNVPVTIEPVDEPVIDRTLDDTMFRAATATSRPNWDAMLARLVNDPLSYSTLRGDS
jgi:dTDP-4-dehydrorhamnose reductase